MRKILLAAGFAAATLLPSAALAQQTCEPQRDTSTAGIAAAAINALLGNPVARTNCAHVYGYYDAQGVWHANQVNSAQAQGYYDAQGRWVVGAPNGYYDSQGRWVQATSTASASGYYDQQGRWVPASATNNGYYDSQGRWIAPTASGYYTSDGRWIAGAATGRYDAQGRWIAGQPAGHRDANGVWVADAQPGYYDSNGRWHAGQVSGYYDAQGRWVSTGPTGGYGAQGYGNAQLWVGAPMDVMGRTAWLEQRIRTGIANRTLSYKEGRRALRQLQIIRQQERNMSHREGQLTPRSAMQMQAKLDRVATSLRWNSNYRGQN